MNRKKFQEWLDQFPEDTEIHVGIQQEPPSYCPYGELMMTKFVGEAYEDYDYTDFSMYVWAKESDWYYSKRILELGVKY